MFKFLQNRKILKSGSSTLSHPKSLKKIHSQNQQTFGSTNLVPSSTNSFNDFSGRFKRFSLGAKIYSLLHPYVYVWRLDYAAHFETSNNQLPKSSVNQVNRLAFIEMNLSKLVRLTSTRYLLWNQHAEMSVILTRCK